MRLDLLDNIERHSRFLSKKVALIDDEGKWTYGALWAEVSKVEQRLRYLDFQDRKRVGLALQPGKAYVAALLGAIKAGLAVVPLNTRLTASELTYFLIEWSRMPSSSMTRMSRSQMQSIARAIMPTSEIRLGHFDERDTPLVPLWLQRVSSKAMKR